MTKLKNPLDKDGDGDFDSEDLKLWLKGAQTALNEAAHTIEAGIKKGGATVDQIISSASKTLQQKLQALNELGRKIGGQKGGPPKGDQSGSQR